MVWGFASILSIEVKGFEVADARAEVAEVEVGSGGAKLWEISGYWSRFWFLLILFLLVE